jgi:hypothetical protein
MLQPMVENDVMPPAAPPAQGSDVFRVATTGPDGTVRTVEVVRTHDGYLRRGDGASEAVGTPDGTDPVALVQAALVVDAVNSVRITPAVWGPTPWELLVALRIDPSALDGEEGDDRFEIGVEGVEERIVAVPCWVGGSHVAGLVHEGRVIPVLLDDDEGRLAGEEIAWYSWSSESGGAPVSWNGGAELLRLNGSLGLDHRWGDMETGSSLFEVPQDSEALAELIGDWLCYDEDSLLAAAFAYEPLDPGGSLSAEDRETWQDLLRAVSVSVTLTLDADTEALVRHVLQRQDYYAAVQDALAHPTGQTGQKLQRALKRFADNGRVLGDMFDWRNN